jgi:putative FmdB family regulatory protein
VPTYEFRCRTCDTVFEERRSMAEAADAACCPEGHPDTVRLISLFASARSNGSPTPNDGGAGGGGGCCGGACGCR